MAALAAFAAPIFGAASMFGKQVSAIAGGDQSGTNEPRPPRVNRRRGMSAAQTKRAARKRRNVLRARGQFRAAVR